MSRWWGGQKQESRNWVSWPPCPNFLNEEGMIICWEWEGGIWVDFEEDYIFLKESLGRWGWSEGRRRNWPRTRYTTESPDNVGDPELTLVPCMYDGFFSFTGVHTAARLCKSWWPVEGMIQDPGFIRLVQ